MVFGPETSLVEMPISWTLDDYPHFEYVRNKQYSMPGLMPAGGVLQNWVDDFDYMTRTMEWGALTYTCHPFVIGRGHRMLMLERLIEALQGLGATFLTMEDAVNAWLERSAGQREARIRVRGLLADHDAGRVEIAADDRRHDRRIRDMEVRETAHLQAVVDDCHRVMAILQVPAGWYALMPPSRRWARHSSSVCTSGSRAVVAGDELGERLGLEDPALQPGAGEQQIEVALIGKEIRLDRRLREGIGGLEADPAPREGPEHVIRPVTAGRSNRTGPSSDRSKPAGERDTGCRIGPPHRRGA